MRQIEFTKLMKILSMSYIKTIDEETTAFWYSQLKDIKYQVLDNAINQIIKVKKFFPTIADLLEQCNKDISNRKFIILERMQNDGYFKMGIIELDREHELRNYEKAKMWANKNIIPHWLLIDMKKYGYIEDEYTLVAENPKLLGGIS